MIASSPLHPNSLVHPSLHSPALVEFVKSDVTNQLVEYLVNTVIEVVDYVLNDAHSRIRRTSSRTRSAEFLKFANDVIGRAQVTTPVVLVSTLYISRAKAHMEIALEQWAYERVFLGALVVANKYLNDATIKNVHWAICTGTFGKRDIGVMEREFLDVIDFDLSISEADVLAQQAGLSALSSSGAGAVSEKAFQGHAQSERYLEGVRPKCLPRDDTVAVVCPRDVHPRSPWDMIVNTRPY